MASLNEVRIIGNLGADPEIRSLPDGTATATLGVATTEVWRDKQGEKVERTEWHRIVFFGKRAEVCREFLHKGAAIYVGGSLRTRKWEDKDGVTRYSTEIIGRDLKMLGKRPAGEQELPATQEPDDAGADVPMPDDDLPF
jgi:single-strand DNA-binding protein